MFLLHKIMIVSRWSQQGGEAKLCSGAYSVMGGSVLALDRDVNRNTILVVFDDTTRVIYETWQLIVTLNDLVKQMFFTKFKFWTECIDICLRDIHHNVDDVDAIACGICKHEHIHFYIVNFMC